jgi:hypothetical protein
MDGQKDSIMAMFKNVNVAPIDTSGFERAGAAYGQMFQNLGNTVADTIQKYHKKKEDKKNLDADTQFWENQIDPSTGKNFNIDIAKTLARNPDLAAQKQNLQQMSLLMEQHRQQGEIQKRAIAKEDREANIAAGIAAASSGEPPNAYDAPLLDPVRNEIKQGLAAKKEAQSSARSRRNLTDAQTKLTDAQTEKLGRDVVAGTVTKNPDGNGYILREGDGKVSLIFDPAATGASLSSQEKVARRYVELERIRNDKNASVVEKDAAKTEQHVLLSDRRVPVIDEYGEVTGYRPMTPADLIGSGRQPPGQMKINFDL